MTLTPEQVRELIVRLLSDIAPEVDLDARPDRDLQDELGLDSMDFLNLMVGIHDATGIEIPERDYARLATLDGALGYLSGRPAPLTA
ncbi:MAG: acyl carrier protein [Actinomycetota bacterium]|nr:acyl carrier protein [Actinomycetota bacterium]